MITWRRLRKWWANRLQLFDAGIGQPTPEPCPFCGPTETTSVVYTSAGRGACLACGCVGPLGDARVHWNNRAPSSRDVILGLEVRVAELQGQNYKLRRELRLQREEFKKGLRDVLGSYPSDC